MGIAPEQPSRTLFSCVRSQSLPSADAVSTAPTEDTAVDDPAKASLSQ